ncbi:MAG: hypothetical protein MZV63_47530 [Marinilabiliales bacterium]|nr:hypothetical protein [Marinilabiliales bacterium]
MMLRPGFRFDEIIRWGTINGAQCAGDGRHPRIDRAGQETGSPADRSG